MINSTIDPVFWFRDKKKAATVCPHEKVRALLPTSLNVVISAMGWAAVVISSALWRQFSPWCISQETPVCCTWSPGFFLQAPWNWKENHRGLAKKTDFLKQWCRERILLHKPRVVLSEFVGLMRVASHFPNSVFFWMSKGPGKHWTYRDCTFSQFVWEMEHPKTIHFTKASEITIFK